MPTVLDPESTQLGPVFSHFICYEVRKIRLVTATLSVHVLLNVLAKAWQFAKELS